MYALMYKNFSLTRFKINKSRKTEKFQSQYYNLFLFLFIYFLNFILFLKTLQYCISFAKYRTGSALSVTHLW